MAKPRTAYAASRRVDNGARDRETAPPGGEGRRPIGRDRVAAATNTRHGAAIASRAQPTKSGLIMVSFDSTAIVAPVVPHEIAARLMKIRPISMARVVYESLGRSPDARAIARPSRST